jgi:catechol 2,3-dioxygenase-like lactoylglutathione lyase family enzyme
MFKETHPILGTRDIKRAIAFYTQQLGFKLAFGDKADPPRRAGLADAINQVEPNRWTVGSARSLFR